MIVPEIGRSWLRPFVLPEPVKSILLSLALVAAGWSVINSARITYSIEGVVTAVRLSTSGQFVIDVKPDGQRPRPMWLRGACETASKQADGPCNKPEFPIGSRLRIEISDYYLSRDCRFNTAPSANPRCQPYLRSWWRTTQRVVNINVDGHDVTSGWSYPSLAVLPYTWIVAFAVTLTLYGWRLNSVPTWIILAFAMFFLPLAVQVTTGLWMQLR